MTLGAAAARVRLIVWCREWSHQVEPAPAETPASYGAAITVFDWRERFGCSRWGSAGRQRSVTPNFVRLLGCLERQLRQGGPRRGRSPY
jgi:hypothetical protein